jgi:hypothetical protein
VPFAAAQPARAAGGVFDGQAQAGGEAAAARAA